MSGTPAGEPNRGRGIAMALGGMLAVSADSPLIRWADADGWVVAFWYGVFTTPVMLGYLWVAERGAPMEAVRRSGRAVWLSAVLQAGSTIAFALAVKATDIANVVAIVAATPIVAAVLAWGLLGERTARRTWLGVIVTVGGVGLVVGGSISAAGARGNLLALVAVVLFSFNLTLWRRHPEMSRTLVIAASGVFAAVIAATQADVWNQSTTTYLATATMGVVFGPAGRILLASSTRFLTAAEVGLVTPVETVAATVWGWLFFAEVPAAATIVGAIVILVGVGVGTIQVPQPGRREAPSPVP